MCGWCRRATAWASRSKRRRVSSRACRCACSTLTATVRRNCVSKPRQTTAMPPWPTCASRRYLPRTGGITAPSRRRIHEGSSVGALRAFSAPDPGEQGVENVDRVGRKRCGRGGGFLSAGPRRRGRFLGRGPGRRGGRSASGLHTLERRRGPGARLQGPEGGIGGAGGAARAGGRGGGGRLEGGGARQAVVARAGAGGGQVLPPLQ